MSIFINSLAPNSCHTCGEQGFGFSLQLQGAAVMVAEARLLSESRVWRTVPCSLALCMQSRAQAQGMALPAGRVAYPSPFNLADMPRDLLP